MPKTVIISGGSRGLGLALINHFFATGCNVATFGRKMTPWVAPNLWVSPLDMRDRNAVADFVRGVKDHFGSVDILVNNAGVAFDGVLATQPDADIDAMLDVNLRGTLALTKACARQMLAQGWGRIVTITSVVAESGFRGLVAYSTTKAGLHGMTRALARELGGRGVTVNAVAPGFLDTDMTHGLTEAQRAQIVRRTPAGRLGRVEDVAPLVRFLCSDEAAFINGQIIRVDGGASA